MPNSDWMEGFTTRGDLTLTDITIPASHDAGMAETHGISTGYTLFSPRKDYISQHYTIDGQLNVGSRFFDLRIAKKSGQLRTFHGEGPIGGIGGGWGQTAASIFQQVNSFLQNHKEEIVILRISHTKAADRVDKAVVAKIHRGRLYRHTATNIAKAKLSDLRGKAIAIYDKDALPTASPQTGNHRFEKYTKDGGRYGLVICGKYAGQLANLKTMVVEALACGDMHGMHSKKGGVKHDHLFMVYWQLAMNIKNKTKKDANPSNPQLRYLDENKGTHFNLDYLLNKHRRIVATRRTHKYRPNIINLDFINEDVCNKVIAFNQELLPPAPPPHRDQSLRKKISIKYGSD